jgi:hypothetical protein
MVYPLQIVWLEGDLVIPKIIHYCWFGKNELPLSAKKCIDSWKKYCPDYTIIEHNENNYDVSKNLYMKEAYEAKKWAFVSDVARLDILYQTGGIYLDTDVELLKPLDEFLNNKGFMGFEDKKQVASGLGIGAEPHSPIVKLLLSDYENIHFLDSQGNFDFTPCPVRNTKTLMGIGLRPNGQHQEIEGFKFYPRHVFSPKESTSGRLKYKTKETVSIHHYDASWQTKQFHLKKKINYIFGGRIGSSIIKFLIKTGRLEE